MKKKLIIIAGPCAAESEEQVTESIIQAKKRKIDFLRISLWKPRTKPGFDGLKEEGLYLLAKAAKMGVNPASEVIMPEHARMVIDTVLNASKDAKVLIWIGARNQNHYIQQEIAKIAAEKGKRVMLLVKNQPWISEEHWEGIARHALLGGIPKTNLFICHRGFTPNGDNPNGFRNIPDFEMATRVREKTGVSMIFDPSHIGGTVENVLKIQKEALNYEFDGIIIEVHPNPKEALTDAKQQLTWKEFDNLMKGINEYS